MYNHKLVVTNIVGESIDGVSHVVVDINSFDAMKQSVFARLNKVQPLLQYQRLQDTDNTYFSRFNINGASVDMYQFKVEGKNRAVFLMNTVQAKALLGTIKKVPAILSKFNLNVVATA